MLAPVQFADDLVLLLAVASDPDVEITTRAPDLRPAPQIIFFASGEVTEGELTLMASEGGAQVARLEWDLLGQVTLESPRSADADG